MRCAERLANAGALLRSDSGLDVVRPVSPPPGVKAKLLARVAARAPRRRGRWAALAAASLVGAVLGGGMAAWVAEQRFAPREDLLRFELALVRDTHRKQEARLEDLRTRLEDVERAAPRFAALAEFGAPGRPDGIGPDLERDQAWRAFLQGAGSRAPGAPQPLDTRAQVFCLESEGLCVLRAAGLPAPRAGESYALWLTNVVGSYYLVGTFEVDANGEASLLASAPVDVREVARSVVTLEPGEAGWRPAGSVVLVDEERFN